MTMKSMTLVALPCLALSPIVVQPQVLRPDISEEVSPVQEVRVAAPDGYEAGAIYRVPPGEGPFPAVVAMLSSGNSPDEDLRQVVLANATLMRLLAAGYVVVFPERNIGRVGIDEGSILRETVAIVDRVKQLDVVASDSVALYGCSVGGADALSIAGETSIAAIVAEEPAGFVQWPEDLDFSLSEVSANPQEYYTPEIQQATREKINVIDGSPILIAQGDQLLLGQIDLFTSQNEILIPELRASGLEVEQIVYPGQAHCFGFNGEGPAALEFFEDMHEFLRPHLPTQPRAIDGSLVTNVEVRGRSGSEIVETIEEMNQFLSCVDEASMGRMRESAAQLDELLASSGEGHPDVGARRQDLEELTRAALVGCLDAAAELSGSFQE